MKYYIIAGEASGDLHASNLMKSLLQQDPKADIRFWGGDLMQKVGGTLVKHYRDLAFMGFWEVVTNLTTIVKNLKFCKDDIKKFNPDALIFIDYPGFNMRIAKWAKERKIATHYYISPQIWAWKENRIKDIKRDFDHLYVILPFEKDFYEKKHGFPVHFVGHPLIDAIKNSKKPNEEKFRRNNQLSAKPIIALLPGSRQQEINKMLTEMLSVVNDFPQYQFIIAGAPGQSREFYSPYLINKNVGFIQNQTYSLLQFSHAALVTSGTATLETALFKVPEVVLYKGNWISYQIAKRIITLKYISLVNLIMDEEIVTELIQEKCNTKQIKLELTKILNPIIREKLIKQYHVLEEKLGGAGASDHVAKLIIEKINLKK
uniref:lipid-A-disaccharide synthase n=1 Tax=Flavobacterium sp. TaxID=239 RepID=UPI00404A9804